MWKVGDGRRNENALMSQLKPCGFSDIGNNLPSWQVFFITYQRIKTYWYVVPTYLKDKVLKGIHDEAGHQGQKTTLYLARQRFYWTGLEKDVRDYVQRCRRCLVSKSPEPDLLRPPDLLSWCAHFWSAEDSSNKSPDHRSATLNT